MACRQQIYKFIFLDIALDGRLDGNQDATGHPQPQRLGQSSHNNLRY